MSILIPSELTISDVEIINHHRTYTSTSIAGVQYRQDTGIQFYKGSITLTAAGFAGAKILNGFIAKLKGRLNSFELTLGGAFGNDGITVPPTLAAPVSLGETAINVSTYTGEVVPAGSIFTVPNDTKVYTTLDDLSPTGNTNLKIVPAMKKVHVANEPINFVNPAITVLLDATDTTIIHSEGGLVSEATIMWTELLGSAVVS